MTEHPDPRPLFTAAWAQTGRVIDAVTPADLDRPTPCADYTVRDLLHHLVSGARRVERIGLGDHFAEVPVITSGIPDDELAARFHEGARRAREVWADDALLGQSFEAPWGTSPGFVVVGGYTQEVLVHGWDLAQGIGFTDLDPALAEAILPIARMVLPADVRGGETPFGAVVEVADDADPYLRLAGWLGRRPLVDA